MMSRDGGLREEWVREKLAEGGGALFSAKKVLEYLEEERSLQMASEPEGHRNACLHVFAELKTQFDRTHSLRESVAALYRDGLAPLRSPGTGGGRQVIVDGRFRS